MIEGDGVHCEGRRPPMYAVMWLCSAARRLVECRTVLLLPSWRVALAVGASRMGTRRVQGRHRDQCNVLWSWCFCDCVSDTERSRFNFMAKPTFFFVVFLPLRHSFWHILSSQTDNKVNSASGCHLLANVIQHQTRLLYSVTLH